MALGEPRSARAKICWAVVNASQMRGSIRGPLSAASIGTSTPASLASSSTASRNSRRSYSIKKLMAVPCAPQPKQ